MTPHDTKASASVHPEKSGDGGAPEIEITETMLDAGAEIYSLLIAADVLDEKSAAKSIFTAMVSASK